MLANLEEQERRPIALRLVFRFLASGAAQAPVAHRGDDPGLLREPHDVQDEGHSPIAHDGGAGEHVDALQLFPERLDDDLLGVADRIDNQSELPAIRVEHDDADDAVAGSTLDAQFAVQGDDRQQVATQPVERRAAHMFEALLRLCGLEAHELDERRLRNGKAFAARVHDQRRDDGERERDLDAQGGAQPDATLDVDRAADALDVRAHHVHADATAGNVADLLRRREPRQEHQLDGLVVVEPCRLLGGHDAARYGLLPHAVRIDAGTVVCNLDVDLPALVERTQHQVPLRRLSASDAVGRRLDAMVHRVAHDVRQRVLDRLDDGLVEFRVLAFHLQANLATALGRQVADDAGELGPQVADRLHPRLHDALLQLGRHQVQALTRTDEPGVGLRRRELEDLVAREHELAHQVHQSVEHGDVDAQRRFRQRRCRVRAAALLSGTPVVTGASVVGPRLVFGSRLGGSRGRDRRQGGLGRPLDGRDRRSHRAWRRGGDWRSRGRGPLALRQRLEFSDQVRVVASGVGAALLDGLQHAARHVHDAEERIGNRGVERECSVTQLAQEVLAGVRDALERSIPKKAGRTLDGVNRAEDTAEIFRISGVPLEGDEGLVERVQVFSTLDEELLHDFAGIHDSPLFADAASAAIGLRADTEKRISSS